MNSLYVYLWTSVKLALRQLLSYKVRSFLTLLGILIGVGAVVAIVSLGEGLRGYFKQAMSSQANEDLVYVMPKAAMRKGRLDTNVKAFKNRDLEMVRRAPSVIYAIGGNIEEGARAKHGWRTEDVGISSNPPDYFAIDNMQIDTGRFFNLAEERGAAQVCVIGADLPGKMYDPNEKVLGSELQVKDLRFTVIGVLKSKSLFENGGQVNTTVYIPLSTGQQRLTGSDDVFWMAAKVKSSRDLEYAKEDIAGALRASRRIRRGADDDFEINTPQDFANFANKFVDTLIMVFGVVAVIALAVGGIGVMNIMLVSVRERTREIGLRKALGATGGNITWQFLIEAMTLTLTGGLLGLALGWGLGAGVSLVMQMAWHISWVPQVPLPWVAAVMLTSVGIGLVFGVYPAWRAGLLDPIAALRYQG